MIETTVRTFLTVESVVYLYIMFPVNINRDIDKMKACRIKIIGEL